VSIVFAPDRLSYRVPNGGLTRHGYECVIVHPPFMR